MDDFARPARFDWTVGLAIACVACSWFLLSSLNTDLGAVQLQFYFYNVLTLMRAPARIISGADGDSLDTIAFGILCILTIVASMAPLFSPRREAWLGCVAPLALILLVAAVLYHGLSQDFITDRGDLGDTGSRLIHLANSFAGRMGGVVARRVHVGVGGYLAVLAAAYLAVKGLRGYQHAA